jgi:hypothetical protein
MVMGGVAGSVLAERESNGRSEGFRFSREEDGGKEAAAWLALSRQRGLFQEPKSQAKGEGLWRLQQGKKRKAPFGLGEDQESKGTTAPSEKKMKTLGLRVFVFS